MPQKRKYHTAKEKSAILREHLLNKIPVSDLCDQHDLQPTLFYRWQKLAFKGMDGMVQKRPILGNTDKGIALHLGGCNMQNKLVVCRVVRLFHSRA